MDIDKNLVSDFIDKYNKHNMPILKTIPGFTKYYISPEGKVYKKRFNKGQNKELKPEPVIDYPNNEGERIIILHDAMCASHKKTIIYLLAKAYLGPRGENYILKYKNGKRAVLDNIEYVKINPPLIKPKKAIPSKDVTCKNERPQINLSDKVRIKFPFSEKCQKVIYPTKKDADTKINHMKSKVRRQPKRAYFCEECKGWHITHNLNVNLYK